MNKAPLCLRPGLNVPSFALQYLPLGSTSPAAPVLQVVRAPTFAEAALKLPAYQWVRLARPSGAGQRKSRQAYRARIQR